MGFTTSTPANNGGQTDTLAIGSGSPAVDYVPESSCTDAAGATLTSDQRGDRRMDNNDGFCDVGAYEWQAALAPPPGVTINSPSAGGIYDQGQTVPTSFSCFDSALGPGIATCRDSNGSTSPGHLDTSTGGPHTYRVTATSRDGQTGQGSVSYIVIGAPSAHISNPSAGGVYAPGQSVSATFACTEGEDGSGLASCDDSHGADTVSGGTGHLDTTTPGPHRYAITATSKDGLTGTAEITYTVADPPTVAIASPASGGTYSPGQVVPTTFNCAEGSGGTGLASCTDSRGSTAPAGVLDTSAPGPHTYAVTATSRDGMTGHAQITYEVRTSAQPQIAIDTRRGRVVRGRTRVRLTCTGDARAGTCTGTLTLSLRERLRHRARSERTLVVARAHYTVASGHSALIAARLSGAGLGLVLGAPRLTLTGRATATPASGSPVSTTIVLQAQVHRRHRRA